MVKYFFIVGQLGNGGLERQLLYLCKELIQNNDEVTVFGWNVSKEDFYYLQFKSLLKHSLICGKEFRGSVMKFSALRRSLKLHTPNTVVSFSAFTNFITYLSCFGMNLKVYGALRTSFDFYIKTKGMKAYLNMTFPKNILVNSINAIEEAKKAKFIDGTRFKFLQNVIDVEGVRIKSKSQNFILNREILNTVSIGNVRPAKRLDRIISLFTHIKNFHTELNIHHYHVGGGDFEDLRDKVAESGLGDFVTILGPKDNVFPIMTACDIVLHFSDVEGASNVVIEAIALGKPVISTNCGDTKYYIDNGVNGFVFDSFVVHDFVDTLIYFSENQDKLEQISNYNKEFIKKFDISKTMEYFLSVTE